MHDRVSSRCCLENIPCVELYHQTACCNYAGRECACAVWPHINSGQHHCLSPSAANPSNASKSSSRIGDCGYVTLGVKLQSWASPSAPCAAYWCPSDGSYFLCSYAGTVSVGQSPPTAAIAMFCKRYKERSDGISAATEATCCDIGENLILRYHTCWSSSTIVMVS